MFETSSLIYYLGLQINKGQVKSFYGTPMMINLNLFKVTLLGLITLSFVAHANYPLRFEMLSLKLKKKSTLTKLKHFTVNVILTG